MTIITQQSNNLGNCKIKYTDIKTSEGPSVKEGDCVEFYYRLALSEEHLYNGNLLESTYSPDVPIRLTISNTTMLEGLCVGMIGMKAGGAIRRIFIPSEFAYGTRAWKNIPANADLVIEVCLGRIVYNDI